MRLQADYLNHLDVGEKNRSGEGGGGEMIEGVEKR